VSVPMTLSDLERRGVRGQIFQTDVLKNSHRLIWNKQIRHDHTSGTGAYGSATPYRKGAWLPSTHNFWGSLLLMYTPFDAKLPNLTWLTHMWGGGLFLWGQPRRQPKRAGLRRSPFWGFSFVYAHTLCRRTIPNLTW